MITLKDKPNTEFELRNILNPLVQKWFFSRFKEFSLPQLYGVMEVHSRNNILISAPTGSTKCLTPDETLLVTEDGMAKLITGHELIEKAKAGKLLKKVDKTGELREVSCLNSFSLDEDNKIRQAKALVYSENIRDGILKIKTEYGREVKISKEHPLLVEGKGWVKAKDLKIGDKIAAPKRIMLPEKEIQLEWEKAISSLKAKAKLCMAYEDFLILKEKTEGFRLFSGVSPKQMNELMLLAGMPYKSLAKETGLSVSQIHRLVYQKTDYKRHNFEQVLRQRLHGIKFEENRIMYKTHGTHSFSFTYPKKLDIKLARWIAFILAEGLIGDYKLGTFLMISQKSQMGLLKEFLQISKEYFNINFVKKNEKDYCVYSTLFCYFLNELFSFKRGRGRYVEFPQWLLNCKMEIKANFLNVFFALEATFTNDEIKISQANKQKIEIINYLLMSNGIFSSMGKEMACATNTAEKIKREYYILTIRQISNLRKFVEVIGINHKHKIRILEHIETKPSGAYVDKFAFDYKKIRALSRHYKNDEHFNKDMGSIYEVVRRTGFITYTALSNLANKLKHKWASEPLLKEAYELLNLPIMWLKVKNITPFDYDGYVFDLTVPNVHNFIGGYGGIILHNTLTAFLSVLNELVDSAQKGILQDKVYCIYISPLRALSRDIQRNLLEPLAEMEKIAGKDLGIRVGVRTSDTTQAEKSKMLKKPPHILITTPETLAILLTTIKFKENLKTAEWCIIDEVHALADNKRGVHLSLSMERLQIMAPGICRVGLSATIAPLEEIAKFLVGNGRDCKIIDVQFVKKLDLTVLSPVEDLINTDYTHLSNETYKIIDSLIQQHKTTLIFTNTRSGTERVVHHLKTRFPGNYYEIHEGPPQKVASLIGAHHGSLSREHRFQIEDALREGKLRAVVSSTSLELGIDIGYIDLVICLGSPKSVARFLQRCLPYEAEILTETGEYLQIGMIVEEKLPLKVITYNPAKGFEAKPVKEYYKYFDNKLYRLRLRCGEEILCTPNHPILTSNGWKKVKDIGMDDKIAEVLHKIQFKNKTPFLYELLPSDKVFVQNTNNFFYKAVQIFINKNSISLRDYAEKAGIPYFRLLDCRRKRGRKKSIRLDYFLKANELAGVKFEEYSKCLMRIKCSGTVWPTLPLKPTKEIMWLAGIVATDGCIVKCSDKRWNCTYYHIKISNKSRKLIEKAKSILNGLNLNCQEYIREHDGHISLELGSNLLAYLLMAFGIKSKNKTRNVEVGKPIFAMEPCLIHAYIEGIFEGDGNFNFNYPLIRIFSASPRFIRQLHWLTARMGYHTNFIKTKAKTSKLVKKVNNKYIYYLHISRFKDIKTFLNNCPCYAEKAKLAKNNINHFKPSHAKKLKSNDAFVHWENIRSIKIIKCNKPVYDISVDNSNFVVGNIIMHNSGRAGHKLHEIVKGKLLVMDRDDLVECSVLLKHAIEKKIDRVSIPTNCSDVLAQQLIGIALESQWNVKELYEMIKKSYCYTNLEWKDFDDILSFLAGEYAALEDRHVYAKIWYDRETNMIGRKGKITRILYMTNIGTIPDASGVTVKIGNQKIGSIDEVFLEKLKPGDRFVLGGDVYEFRFARGTVAQVKSASGKKPTIPSWFSESLPLSFDLAMGIQRFRKIISEMLTYGKEKDEIIEYIKKNLYVQDTTATAIYNYLFEQHSYIGIPHETEIIVEHYSDGEKKFAIFHTLYGRRVNDVLSRAVAYAISRLYHKDVDIGINDNGFFIAYAKGIDTIKAFKLLKANEMHKVARYAIENSEALKRKFRHCAGRALMILREYKGVRKGVGKQQTASMILLAAVRRISEDFVILKEARREVLEDQMDIDNAAKVIKAIEDKQIKLKMAYTDIPSPFAFNLIMQGYSDIMKMEDKAEFLKRMHQMVLAKVSLKQGKEKKKEIML